ncbi:MAG: ABC transporter permease [Chloroflexi bacterium]|nr:MAG: ABC transporter permease [Chloroflexota bacterium]
MAETDTNSTTTDVGKVLLNEINKPARRDVLGVWNAIRVPVLAVLTGLVLGGIFIIATTETVYAAFGTSIGAGLNEAWRVVIEAYGALFSGSLGDPARMVAALRNGDALEIRRAFNPFLESLVTSTPYIFAGLGVALGFRAGVFNIGAEGQIFMGAIFSAYVGYAIKGLPAVIHIPVALLAGAIGGGIWGFIPGWLKAKVGGHEVINTIMMNYIAFRMSDWLLSGPMKRPNSFNPISPTIEESAMLPQFFGDPIRFHLGFFVALGTAALVSWFLFKTIWGFDLRTVGANPFAGRYAGMKVSTNIMLAMTLSGALCGLAGTNEVRGLNHNLAMAFSSGYGFDSIALALLGNNTPLGVVLASLLFGTLRTGATRMQLVSAIPVDIISVLQAIILALIAAPVIVRVLFNLRTVTVSQTVTVKGWGGK